MCTYKSPINKSFLNLCSGVLILFLVASACGTGSFQSITGKYRATSKDPVVNRFLQSEDNYLMINEDNTIIYHSTINSKPKYLHKGSYEYAKDKQQLVIRWQSGKLPSVLQFDETGSIIIGNTVYVKSS